VSTNGTAAEFVNHMFVACLMEIMAATDYLDGSSALQGANADETIRINCSNLFTSLYDHDFLKF
jgi:hypothetical protein